MTLFVFVIPDRQLIAHSPCFSLSALSALDVWLGVLLFCCCKCNVCSDTNTLPMFDTLCDVMILYMEENQTIPALPLQHEC